MASLGDLFAGEAATIAEAMEWYRLAAERGHKAAQIMLRRIDALEDRKSVAPTGGLDCPEVPRPELLVRI
jgi:TPR repeat protein